MGGADGEGKNWEGGVRVTTVIEYDTDAGELTSVAREALWAGFKGFQENAKLLRFRDYSDGRAGVPDVRDGASEEIKELAQQSVRNVCGVVVDTFDRGLSVVGFRSPTESDDEPAWAWWQRNRLDARQHEVHRAALTYGWSWVSVLPDDSQGGAPVPATWTPLSVHAEWDDPRRDLFPTHAVLVREVTRPMLGRGWSVLFVDDTWAQEAFIPKSKNRRVPQIHDLLIEEKPWKHGASYDGKPVCPLVWFPNERTAEDRPPRGEVEPLIQSQRAINSVNFDRLAISRFSAFKQKVVIGWTAEPDQVARASASSVWTFEDDPKDVSVQQLDASPLAPYDDLLREMTEQVALQAGIPLHQLTGSLQNVSQETAALAEAAHQRKLGLKREVFGESWEQVIRLAAEMSGEQRPDDAAEMLWLETEARSFAGVVDGIYKLATIPADASGVPVEQLLDLIPGMNQQKMYAIREALESRRLNQSMLALTALAPETLTETPQVV